MNLEFALKQALSAGVPAGLVANILTTSNTVRLRRYFSEAAARFLVSHQRAQHKPSSVALKERNRLKALLTLIRARRASAGIRKGSVAKELHQLDKRITPVLLTRSAAVPHLLAA